jgi:branched-chain amino acid transport system permease protein
VIEFLQILVNGIFTGGVYAIIGIGLSLIFGVMRVVNFAHGVFLVVGMFTTLFLFERLNVDPFLLILPVVLVGGLLGLIVERVLLEPITRAPEYASILMTVGIGLVLSNLLLFTFGDAPQIINTRYSTSTWHLGPITFSTALTVAFVLAVAVIAGLALLLERTDLGRAIRATAQHADAAELQGINTRRVRGLVFGIGFALAALAGALLLPQLFAHPSIGPTYTLKAFVVTVLGGMGNVAGAIGGGLLLGITESLGAAYVSSSYRDAFGLVAFLLVLLFRPAGLFGRSRT